MNPKEKLNKLNETRVRQIVDEKYKNLKKKYKGLELLNEISKFVLTLSATDQEIVKRLH